MDINTVKTFFTDTDGLAWLAWASFTLTIYFYLKSVRAKRPYCICLTHLLTNSSTLNVPGLQILYQGTYVQNLAITKVVFWNAGKETINKNDVPAVTPFSIEISGLAQLLNHSVEFIKTPSNSISFTPNALGNGLIVNFDYFDKNDGFVLELLHTGESNQNVIVTSVFKGAKPLIRRNSASFLFLPKFIRRLLETEHRAVLALSFLVTPYLSTALLATNIVPSHIFLGGWPPTPYDITVLVIMWAVFTYMGVYLLRTKLPAGFNIEW